MYKRATKDVQMNEVPSVILCGHKIDEYTDNDALHKPTTRGEQVYAVEGALIGKAAITEKYATVFGIGELEGEYRIRLDDTVDPIQHAPPRRVPVALRDRLKATLDDMVRDDITEAVEKRTEWISSMVVTTKKDSKLRICRDPSDLNRAIRRENYQLPTIENIAKRLHGAKVFTVLDVRHGFWHVRLDDRSSYLQPSTRLLAGVGTNACRLASVLPPKYSRRKCTNC